MEAQKRELTKEIRGLEQKEREATWDDLTPYINKCFRRRLLKPGVTGWGDVFEYAVIISLPPVVTPLTGSPHMNKYQLPAIHFKYSEVRFVPFTTSDESAGDEEVFWFENVFTGDLPESLKYGALYNGLTEEWEEISHSTFIFAAEGRFRQFIKKIFEPTTPAW